MKRTITVLLALLLICGAFSAAIIPASAEENDVLSIETEEFVDALNAYVKETGLGKLFSAMLGKTGEYTYTTKTVKEDIFLMIKDSNPETALFAFNTLEPYEASEVIDGYQFINPAFLAPTEMSDKLGMCVYKDGKIYTLREAVEQGISTAEELAKLIPRSKKVDGVFKSEEFINGLNEFIENNEVVRKYVFGNDKKQKLDAYNIESKIDLYKEYSDGTVVFSFVKNSSGVGSYEFMKEYGYTNVLFFGTDAYHKSGVFIYNDGKVLAIRSSVAPARESVTDVPTVSPKKDGKKANTMKVTVKTKTVKAKSLKNGKVTVSAVTVKNAEGKLCYKKLSGSKKLTVTKNGKITVKKGTKKGIHRIKIKITAKGNSRYLENSVTRTVKIKVK